MPTLHTFGCSITQGFALPDVVRPILDDQGQPLTEQQIQALGQDFNWEEFHIYQPSEYAWPAVLANQLGYSVINHARRGACFQQIARQVTVGSRDILPEDTAIVMWTYLSRLSLQWPARTAVPFCNIADPNWGWQTVILGFNRFFGLERSRSDDQTETEIQSYIETATKNTYLDPMRIYDRYYNSLVLQQLVDSSLRSLGCRVIHLSVESQTAPQQLERARRDLLPSLREPYRIPDPSEWYCLDIDHACAPILFDTRIPLAKNDMHPSVDHHRNFAGYLRSRYFQSVTK